MIKHLRYMKINKYIGIMMMATVTFVATSCSDWNDWNTVPTDVNASAEKTLWENISSNSQLSDFAKIVEAAGLKDYLNTTRYYTVWAPLNGTYDADSVLNNSSTMLEQFVYNHIAEYSHQAQGSDSVRIHTLNEKSYTFKGNGVDYTFNDVYLSQKNLPSNNGILHILNGNSPFLPNAYQSIWMEDDIDSIANYFKKYELTYLDENSSVAGPIVNGKQTYIDSVMVTYNSMSNSIRARLDSEDSLYTMILPNNEAYMSLYNKIATYYNYAENTQAQDVENATSTTYTTLTAPTTDLAYLKDSLIRRHIVNNLVYSHNNKYNARFFDGTPYIYNGQGEPEDTVFSTYRKKFSNPEDIFNEENIIENVKLSNGRAVIVDSLAFYPWETYNPQITVRGISACRYLTGTRKNIRVSYPDETKVTLENGEQLTFIEVTPSSSFSKPEVDYYLTGILSGTYNIYVVIPPADVDLEDTSTEVKPNWLNFTLNYYNGSRLVDYKFTNERYVAGSQIITYNQNTGAEVKTNIANTDFFNDTTKVDTLLLGKFTFPRCYSGLGAYYPNIKVTMPSTFSTLASKGHTAAFDRTIRICSIILRPVEYDEFLKEEEQ